MKALRFVAGAAGVAAMVLGAVLLTAPQVGRPMDVLWWIVGAVVLHDGVVVPVTLAAGALLPPRLLRSARGALIATACLTAVALPVLLRPGPRANASVLPSDYGRNLLIALGAVAVVTLARYALKRLLRPSRADPAGRDGSG